MQPRSRKLCHSLTLLRAPSTPNAPSEWSKTHPPLLCFRTAGCINTDSQHFWCYLQNEWAVCPCSHSLCTQLEWDCPLFFARRKRLLFACLAFLFFSAGTRQMKLFMCSSLQKAKSLSEKFSYILQPKGRGWCFDEVQHKNFGELFTPEQQRKNKGGTHSSVWSWWLVIKYDTSHED